MRVTVLAILLVASAAHADRGHQAYEDQLERSAKAHEEWINKPCTPRGRFLVKTKTSLWTIRLHTTGYWRVTIAPFGITKTGCDKARRRHVFVHWH